MAGHDSATFLTRHIVDAMNAAGYRIETILACGGDTENPVFLREHADATGCRFVPPREPESVLLGAAVLGAVATGAPPLGSTVAHLPDATRPRPASAPPLR